MSRVADTVTITAGHGGNIRFSSSGVTLGSGLNLEVACACPGAGAPLQRISVTARTEMYFRPYTGAAPLVPTASPHLVASGTAQSQGFDHLAAGESADIGEDLNGPTIDGITFFAVGAPAVAPGNTEAETFRYEGN